VTCSATRLILLAWAVGLVASTLLGSDALGWAAAGLAVVFAVLVDRRMARRHGPSCMGHPEGVCLNGTRRPHPSDG
jgi:hypothetical protein